MRGFKKKPAVLPAAEPSAAKLGEDEGPPETRFETSLEGGGEAHGEANLEGGAEGSGETGIAGHKKKRARSGLPPWLHIKPQDRWPLVRVALVVVLCISAGWYFVDFYGGKDAQAGQALSRGGVASASASRAGARGTVSATPTSTPTPSASVKWTPTAQEAKKRAEALSMPLPAKPEEITQNTDDGAVATAKYAVDLYNYAFSTGKVEEYKALCKGSHKSCATTPAAIQKLHADGGWVDEMHVTFMDGWVRKDIKDKVVVELWYYQTGGIEYLGDGSKVDVKQSKWAALVTLSYNGNNWQVEVIYGEQR